MHNRSFQSPLARDFSSLSNCAELTAEHMHLDMDISFERKTIIGQVTFTVNVTSSTPDQFVLDTKSLQIIGVKITDSKGKTSKARRR